MSLAVEPRDCEFDIGEFVLRARHWSRPGGTPVLALHGWLDNCASFDFLAPHLKDADLVALDLAGHGCSDHRKHRGAYNIWQDVGEVFAVADALGWQEFSLLGHSRGATVALLAAGTLPQRIQYLGLLDGSIPQVAADAEAPANLAASIVDISHQINRPRRFYSRWEDAVTAREKAQFPLPRPDAEVLARRGVQQFDEGFAWLYDTRLLARSELRLTLEQVDAFVARIEAQTLLITAADSFLKELAPLQQWLAAHKELPQLEVGGGHHCHMSENAQGVAAVLRQRLPF